jgi:mRNA-degrading endonuclease RelE of RelBE toxin-antitoxin system
LKNKKLAFSKPFQKLFEKLPAEIRQETYQKLDLLLKDPSHPSLRVKKIKGTSAIWEMSVTMNYRITFEVWAEEIFLRRIGIHDILRHP